MISTLVDLLGGFYESNDFARVEAIAQSIHTAVPDDQVSLKFLGLAYYRTGRINDAMRLFDRIQKRQNSAPETAQERMNAVGSAVVAVAQEASRRVPYLAQAWRDLGCALLKLRPSERMVQPFNAECPA